MHFRQWKLSFLSDFLKIFLNRSINNMREMVTIVTNNTMEPVCNDLLYNKIYYLWFTQ